jgi:hypothetical protein
MFKKYFRFLFLTAIFFLFIPLSFATSGACSGHGGVNCSTGSDSDGSVICNDGWTGSSVEYSSMSMCVGSPTGTSPAFSDIDLSPYKNAIEFVKSEGIVDGYPDGTYRPDNKINRAEFTKILTQTAFSNDLISYIATACFKDVSANTWFAKYVCLAKDKTVIGGYPDNTFRADKNINVAESLKITLSALYENIPEASGNWYQKYVDFAVNNNLMLEEWSDITKEIDRGEMAEFIFRIKGEQP